jgi:hypothetical protein
MLVMYLHLYVISYWVYKLNTHCGGPVSLVCLSYSETVTMLMTLVMDEEALRIRTV